MSKVKYAKVYNYLRTGKLNDQGEAVVYIRTYLNAKYKFFSTGVHVAPNQWDNKNHKVTKHPLQIRLNQRIRDLETKIENFELDIVKRDGNISLDKLALYDKEVIDISFIEFYEQQLNQRSSRISKQSFTDQRQTLDKLKAYRSSVYFHEVTHRLISSFDAFLYKSGLRANTIAKHHKNLKTYINKAIEYNYLDSNKNPYSSFKIKTTPTERIFLDQNELDQLAQLEIQDENKKND